MTVIAWDGKTLAADKASTNCGHRLTTTKIHRVAGSLIALTGDECDAMEVLQWFRDGEDPKTYPEGMKADNATAYVVRPDGALLKYTKRPFPARIEDKKFAGGSGRDYALAAMHLGCDARAAVTVAIVFDNACGNGIDALELI